jgi:ATP/ADP translocase
MKILKNKNYPTVMYILIIIVSLVLFFNFQNILEKRLLNYPIENGKITAHVISDKIDSAETSEQKINRSYYIYNITILVLFILISMILIRFIYRTKI